ncbi:MAG: TonB-dependent receptor [Chitinophagaceae bacterium]
MRILTSLFSLFSILTSLTAQPVSDTIPQLGLVRVQGFGTISTRLQTPASVSTLREADLQRYQGTSLLPAVNNIPGVRMEERSPGSYRLSIRGSLLRSPFGVRNVKLYLDDFILTDAGGNSYLNLLDLNALSSVEVLRGPSGSTYGTGTGGVVLLSTQPGTLADRSDVSPSNGLRLGLSAGSYGLFAQHARFQASSGKRSIQVSQGHYQSDGYRDNSRMRRDVFQWSATHRLGDRDHLKTLLLLSDLDYRTPGGLTSAQMQANPRQARPATPVLPGALSQQAGIRNRSVISGISHTRQFDAHWSWMNSLTFAYTDFRNPFITNYEKRHELNLGLRSVAKWKGEWLNRPLVWQSGFEWQRGFYRIDSTGNKAGVPDANLVRDQAGSLQAFLFSQADYRLTKKLSIQAGISVNQFNYRISRTIGKPEYQTNAINFKPQAVPRLALLRTLGQRAAWHASITRGFSAPSLAEVRPSAGGFSTGLQAERGWSRETGIKGSVLKNRLQYDITWFRFDLRDAIVRRTNAAGAEFFLNAGEILQQGLEGFVEAYPVHRNLPKGLLQLKTWVSLTRSDFRFGAYQSGSTSLNNKRLTGVPRTNMTAGFDLTIPGGLYLTMTHQYTDSLPLTDANDAFASAYCLLSGRLGWKGRVGKLELEGFIAGDNLLNASYSLGNDLNAFGRRYFNPAPLRNWVGGVVLRR